MVEFFFQISKTQNLFIDLNIELYTSVIVLYDVNIMFSFCAEFWKENYFLFFFITRL